MNFSCCVVEKGPGLWVLNNTVLANEIYVKRVKEIIADSVNTFLDLENILCFYHLL
jgi:hypothetical protein